MPRLTPEQAAAGFTELHAAAHAGVASEVNALLEAGAVATALTAQSDSALHLAALGGHANVTRTLLAVAPSLLAETNAGGWTPLMLAVLSPAPPHHRTRCTALLLEAKADPWAATAQGWGALLLAAQRGDAATLGLVLARTQAAHGAGRLGELLQSLQTAEGDGALHLAASRHGHSARVRSSPRGHPPPRKSTRLISHTLLARESERPRRPDAEGRLRRCSGASPKLPISTAFGPRRHTRAAQGACGCCSPPARRTRRRATRTA